MKAILLDLDDTLLDDRCATDKALSALLKFHRHALPEESDLQSRSRWRRLAGEHWQRFERAEVSFAGQRRQRVCDFLGSALDDAAADAAFEPYRQVYESSWALLPGVARFLQATALIPKVIVTNGEREQQLRKIRSCGLTSYIVGVVTPMDCGYWKPDPRIFLAAMRLLSVEAKDCLMIGDDLSKDIEPAKRLGMQALLVEPGLFGQRLVEQILKQFPESGVGELLPGLPSSLADSV